MSAFNLDFLNSSGATATGAEDFNNLPSDLGFRSDAGSATQKLQQDDEFMLPRVKDVSAPFQKSYFLKRWAIPPR
jgi:hypothetical protein